MPRIRAYKQADKLIPVDNAKIVTAFQCPWTKKIYNRKKDYIKHLKDLRHSRMHRRIIENRLSKAVLDLNSQTDFTSVIEWIERNSWLFLANVKRNNIWRDTYKWPTPEEFWIRITFLDVHHQTKVSNSHCAPRGKPSNWGRTDPSLPIGYPGWSGRIEFQLSHDLPGFSSDLLRSTGIHTGGGGSSGNTDYGYAVTFWDDDWPNLNGQLVMNILAEKPHGHFIYGKPKYYR